MTTWTRSRHNALGQQGVTTGHAADAWLASENSPLKVIQSSIRTVVDHVHIDAAKSNAMSSGPDVRTASGSIWNANGDPFTRSPCRSNEMTPMARGLQATAGQSHLRPPINHRLPLDYERCRPWMKSLTTLASCGIQVAVCGSKRAQIWRPPLHLTQIL